MALSKYADGIWQRVSRLSGIRRTALLKAIWQLARARHEHRRKPVKAVLERFETTLSQVPATQSEAELVGWAIGSAAARVPWRSDCLLQAMAASMWLDRMHRCYKLNIGVRKTAGGELEAHAWLTSGSITVTGDLPDLDGFSTIPLKTGISKL